MYIGHIAKVLSIISLDATGRKDLFKASLESRLGDGLSLMWM